jgi:ferredoxin
VTRLWQARRNGSGFQTLEEGREIPKYAFIGVRSCELHAIAIQDKVFLQGNHVDPAYKARREGVFVVAVNCGQAAGTCFCVSMNTGPKAKSGFDIALTEVLEGQRHYFVAEVGTEAGTEALQEIPHREATAKEKAAAEGTVAQAAAQMGRTLDTTGIKELLYQNYDHPRWDDVAKRCLTCGNCTMVCPTCFCSTVEDYTDLKGEHAERLRKLDSCFTMDFSYIHGGSIRASAKSRYRQWMTHKLATWIDQFGTSGCVGCGRCITWCPVGIDITAEVRAIRESKHA